MYLTRQIAIKSGHKLFNLCDEYAFLSKNLYNVVNYQLRQILILTNRIKQGLILETEDLNFLININPKITPKIISKCLAMQLEQDIPTKKEIIKKQKI